VLNAGPSPPAGISRPGFDDQFWPGKYTLGGRSMADLGTIENSTGYADLRRENRNQKRQIRSLESLLERTKAMLASRTNVATLMASQREDMEKNMNLLLENSPDIILLFDQAGRFAYCSRTFLTAAQIANFGLINGHPFQGVFRNLATSSQVDNLADNYSLAMREQKTVVVDDALFFPGLGDTHVYKIHITPMLGEGGSVEGAMMLFHDLTDIMKAKDAAEKANRAKSDFLAHMSHEIRTPMSAILGISEIRLRDERLSADAEEGFRKIYDSGNLLLNIINDILDFSKIDAGKMEIVPNKYDIPSLINDTMQLCRLRFESKQIAFNLYIGENTPLELIGDQLRLKQILNNLLSNAFKYTETGEVGLSVAVEPGPGDEAVILVLTVSDTGQGMTEEQIGRIFEEYSRFNMEMNSGIPGTGLGMNITKRLIEMMEGEIFVASEVGQGSVFTVRLPQKSCGSAACGAEIAESLRNFNYSNATITKRIQIEPEYMPYGRVLVVDDVESNLYVARGLLAPYGLSIETANSGVEAIEKIKNNEYDIVFMDHMMPVMDGIKAANILRGSGYNQPIVALTANAISGQAEMFLSNGFDRFISKPIDARELDLALKELIRDRKPPEILEAARREKHKAVAASEKNLAELRKYFIKDAENIIKVLENIYAKMDGLGDTGIESYTTAVHGIKSALRNIGETKLSEFAFRLEHAGEARDFDVIFDETPALIENLKDLVAKLKPKKISGSGEVSRDDMLYLKEKLYELGTACEIFNIRAAETVLIDLEQRTWPREIDEAINEISVNLLRGEYKKVVCAVEQAMKIFSTD
jgi:signal transduction histidine kinase/DNA-binding NarL/FixJ family response regulator